MSKKLPSRRSKSKQNYKSKNNSVSYRKGTTAKKPRSLIHIWGLKSESDSTSKEHYKHLVTLLLFILLLVALVCWLIPDSAIGAVATTGLFKFINLFKNRSP